MSTPSIKAMAAHRGLKLGHFLVEFATPGIGQILKAAGCDFVILDTEHSGFGIDTVKTTLRYMQAADLPTIVRAPSHQYHHVARIADAGAEGIMAPMVNSAEEARALLASLKYHPLGTRGVALQIAHDRYAPGPVLNKLSDANARTALFAQIETRAGVENADAIAAIDGVDCLWIGHFDLSCSLGIPGEFEHPEFLAAVETVAAACQRHDKSLGRLAPSVQSCIELRAQGFDWLSYSGDVWAFHAAISEALTAVRAGCQELIP